MRAAWLCAGADLRRRWRSVIFLSLLLGVAGGFALTALVGAGQTSTGWDRFRRDTRAPDAFVSIPSRADPRVADELRSMPGVVDAASFAYVVVAPGGMPEGGAFAAADDRFGRSIYRSRVLQGRLADPDRADEITVNRAMAEAAHLRAGDLVRLASPPPSTFSTEVTVVGVTVGALDVSQNAGSPAAYLTPAFLEEHADDVETGRQNQFVRLAGGTAGVPAFRAAVTERFDEGGGVLVGSSNEEDKPVKQALSLQAWSLALVAAAAATSTLVVLGQALVRHISAGADDGAALKALGMTRAQRASRSLPTIGLVTGLGTLLGLAVAATAHPLVPKGLAGDIEPHPGIAAGLPALAGGAALLAVLVVATGAGVAWRVARVRTQVATRRADRSSSLHVRPTLKIGLANAAGGGTARSRATARQTIAAAIVGTMGVAAAITFAASLDHLVTTSRLYGWTFDALLGVGGEDPAAVDAAAEALVAEPAVTRLAVVSVDFVTLGEESVEALLLDSRKGQPIHPPVRAGRAPSGSGEVAMGAKTMKRLGVKLGSRVQAVGVSGPVELLVVGEAVYPVLGDGTIDDAVSLDWAAGLSLRREESRGRLAMMSVTPGTDPAALAARHTDMPVGAPVPPSPVTNLRLIRSAPWLLAAFLSAIALAAVGHALVLSVRAGRREVGVLRALGFVRNQVRLTVFWQATATVMIGLVIGLPLGVALGRWLWGTVAGRNGVLVEPVVAVALLALVAPAALVLANLIAAVPARAAARSRPALALRTE